VNVRATSERAVPIAKSSKFAKATAPDISDVSSSLGTGGNGCLTSGAMILIMTLETSFIKFALIRIV
jgi:hypothetical protein